MNKKPIGMNVGRHLRTEEETMRLMPNKIGSIDIEVSKNLNSEVCVKTSINAKNIEII